MKEFNIAGLCVPEKHYMVDISERVQEIRKKLVDKGKYFCINRARQYGKTTTLAALKRNLQDKYIVVSLDFQKIGDGVFHSEGEFTQALARLFSDAAEFEHVPIPEKYLGRFEELNSGDPKRVKMDEIFREFKRWCLESEKPVVLIIDEVDSATNNQVFLDFLAQLREGYLSRESDGVPTFASVILSGVTDVKNLKRKLRPEESHKVNSPWNIAVPFTMEMSLPRAGVEKMLDEYAKDHHFTFDTGTVAAVIDEYTSGYPFLVSSICRTMDTELVGSSKRFKSRKNVWTPVGVGEAVRRMLEDSNTLFDSLHKQILENEELEKLIRRILFAGERFSYSPAVLPMEDAVMHGFVTKKKGAITIANRIFETRLYNYYLTVDEMKSTPAFQAGVNDKEQFVKGGKLLMDKLLSHYVTVFDDLYGESEERFSEDEGRRRFLLYIRPIINGTGNYYIEAETRNSRRMDLVIDYLGEQFIVELKIWGGKAYHTKGEDQLADYLESKHLAKGYLLTYSFNKKKTPGVERKQVRGKEIVEVFV